jgi:uncharacterized membrane protein
MPDDPGQRRPRRRPLTADHGGGHGHGHSHGGSVDWRSAASTRRALSVAAAVIVGAAVVGLVTWWPSGDVLLQSESVGFGTRVEGTVTGASVAGCSYAPELLCDEIAVEITSGPERGATTSLEFALDEPSPVPAATLRAGDDIVLNDAGPSVPTVVRYSFADFQRSTPLVALVVLFAVVIVIVGRWRGLLALIGLGASLAVVFAFVLPALLRGSSPVGVAVTGACVIALIALYLAHGVTERTTVALIGTVVSLALTGALAALFASSAELTGLASEESISLLAFAPELDFRGLLLAAVIIGSLGVLDDVTVTQVSAVWELHGADERLGFRRLYAAAVRIGRDHIASATNTLVLAYTAAALPLLLIFTQSGLSVTQVVTTETVAVEVVQTLVGSIGLVASVPITTALAAWVVTRR